MTELLDEDLVVKQVIDRYLFFNRLLYTQILKQIKKFQAKYSLRKLVLLGNNQPQPSLSSKPNQARCAVWPAGSGSVLAFIGLPPMLKTSIHVAFPSFMCEPSEVDHWISPTVVVVADVH